MAYSADLGAALSAAPLASNGPTTHTQNQNVTAQSGGDKGTLYLAVGVVIACVVVLLIGRGALRNARIA